MDVLIILVFASLILVGGALVMLFWRVGGGDFEHSDRLSLLPLEPEPKGPGEPPGPPTEDPEGDPRPS